MACSEFYVCYMYESVYNIPKYAKFSNKIFIYLNKYIPLKFSCFTVF